MGSEAPLDSWFITDGSPAASLKQSLVACLGILLFGGMVYIFAVYLFVVLMEFWEAVQWTYAFFKKLLCSRKKNSEIDEEAAEVICMKTPKHDAEPFYDIEKGKPNNNYK